MLSKFWRKIISKWDSILFKSAIYQMRGEKNTPAGPQNLKKLNSLPLLLRKSLELVLHSKRGNQERKWPETWGSGDPTQREGKRNPEGNGDKGSGYRLSSRHRLESVWALAAKHMQDSIAIVTLPSKMIRQARWKSEEPPLLQGGSCGGWHGTRRWRRAFLT